MTKLKYLTLASITILLVGTAAMSQSRGGPDEACGGVAGCGACGGSMVFFLVIIVAYIALSVALLIWVARDAKARGMDSAVIWMILVALTNWIGLLIYIFSRPQGTVVQCPHCNNKRLQASAKCPHCGNP